MPNLPYWTEGEGGAEAQAAAEEFRQRRGGKLHNVDRILLHSPVVAAAWAAYFGPLRKDLLLAPRHAELAMCAVGVLSGAQYVFHHHAPLLLAAGASREQVDALADVDAAIATPELFDAAELAVLRLARDSTRHVAVPPEVLEEVRRAFPDPRLVVELLAVIGAYNMSSRLLVAAGVEIEAKRPEVD